VTDESGAESEAPSVGRQYGILALVSPVIESRKWSLAADTRTCKGPTCSRCAGPPRLIGLTTHAAASRARVVRR